MNVRELESVADLREAEVAHHRAWERAFEGILPEALVEQVTRPPTEEELRERREAISDEAGRYLVAERDDRVVGYARFRWADTKAFVGEDEAGLKEIYVHPDHWGEGVGTALVERGVEQIPADREAVVLEVLAENDRARAFYEARGFECEDTYVEEMGGRPIEHAIYRRPLND